MIGHALPVYRGYSSQYGYGLGNILGGVVRAAVPLIANVAKKAGSKLLSEGIDMLERKITKRKASGPPQKPVMKRRKVTSIAAAAAVPNKKAARAPRGFRPRRRGRRKLDIFDRRNGHL